MKIKNEHVNKYMLLLIDAIIINKIKKLVFFCIENYDDEKFD